MPQLWNSPLKAMTTAPGMANSTVTSGLYTIH